jgi:hypothetical protein
MLKFLKAIISPNYIYNPVNICINLVINHWKTLTEQEYPIVVLLIDEVSKMDSKDRNISNDFCSSVTTLMGEFKKDCLLKIVYTALLPSQFAKGSDPTLTLNSQTSIEWICISTIKDKSIGQLTPKRSDKIEQQLVNKLCQHTHGQARMLAEVINEVEEATFINVSFYKHIKITKGISWFASMSDSWKFLILPFLQLYSHSDSKLVGDYQVRDFVFDAILMPNEEIELETLLVNNTPVETLFTSKFFITQFSQTKFAEVNEINKQLSKRIGDTLESEINFGGLEWEIINYNLLSFLISLWTLTYNDKDLEFLKEKSLCSENFVTNNRYLRTGVVPFSVLFRNGLKYVSSSINDKKNKLIDDIKLPVVDKLNDAICQITTTKEKTLVKMICMKRKQKKNFEILVPGDKNNPGADFALEYRTIDDAKRTVFCELKIDTKTIPGENTNEAQFTNKIFNMCKVILDINKKTSSKPKFLVIFY